MKIDAINLLNPRLLNFLSNRLGWKSLNPIQEKAIPEIIMGNDTLVIAPTASGKTEAVLIPIFNEILSNDLEPLSVLYISPLKALINDMYERIESWGKFFNLSVTKWHGDVSKSTKNKFVKTPTDFLAITPESLEVILFNNKTEDKENIFKNLKYIIIDEIHYFADSDRGTQLNSILNRIREYCGDEDIVKIGLSATVGNPESVAKWLNHQNIAKIITDNQERIFQYKLSSADEDIFLKNMQRFKNNKILIFANSRASVEYYYQLIKHNLNIKNIFIHHSSISKEIREENEKRFKEENAAFMISTSTLELGIDIGDIDVVFQIGAPSNVSSFAQRIGRSGRRSKIQRSIIYAHNMDVIKSLAILILRDANKIEKINIPTKAKDILFHQILSSVFEHGKIYIKDLYDNLINCLVFSEIAKEEFHSIIKNMVKLDFLRFDHGFLTIGYEFEQVFGLSNFMEFYSVFCPNFEFKIKKGRVEIGSVSASFAITSKEGDCFTLGGKNWQITKIDSENFTIYVKEEFSPDKDIPNWQSEGMALSYEISRKVYDILIGDFDKSFLEGFNSLAKDTVDVGIRKSREIGFSKGIIPVSVSNQGTKVQIFTFAGHDANYLLGHIFKMRYGAYNINRNPYNCSFRVKEPISVADIESVIYGMDNIINGTSFDESINDVITKFYKNKFIRFLPHEEEVKMKIELLFDKNGLLDVCKNNMVRQIPVCDFDNWFNDSDEDSDYGEDPDF